MLKKGLLPIFLLALFLSCSTDHSKQFRIEADNIELIHLQGPKQFMAIAYFPNDVRNTGNALYLTGLLAIDLATSDTVRLLTKDDIEVANIENYPFYNIYTYKEQLNITKEIYVSDSLFAKRKLDTYYGKLVYMKE